LRDQSFLVDENLESLVEYAAANCLGVESERLEILEESGHMVAGLLKDQIG